MTESSRITRRAALAGAGAAPLLPAAAAAQGDVQGDVSGAGAPAPEFGTLAEVAGVRVTAGVTHIRTAGHSAPGDGGGALYRRVDAEPAHGLKVRSADGAWWALVPEAWGVSVLQAGGDAAGRGDNLAAIDAAVAFLGETGGTLHFPAGKFNVSGQVDLPHDIRITGAGIDVTTVLFTVRPGEDWTAGHRSGFAFKPTAAHCAIADMTVRSEKENWDPATTPTTSIGQGAISIRCGGTFSARNVRVLDFIGHGFREGAEGNTLRSHYENCHVRDVGAHPLNPSFEVGDGFYSDGGRSAAYVNCHYTEAQRGPDNARITRGGFVCVNEHAESITILGCSSVGAHRAIHLEQVPRNARIEGFHAEDARNGLICYGPFSAGVAQQVTLRSVRFKGCGLEHSGAIHTANAVNLNLVCEDVLIEDVPGSYLFRHSEGLRPRSIVLRNVRYAGTPIRASFSSAGPDGDIGHVAVEDCELPAVFDWSGIAHFVASGSTFGRLDGANGGPASPPRQHRLTNCVIGRGETSRPLVGYAPYSGLVVLDGCTFEYDNETGSAAIVELNDTSQCLVIAPHFDIRGRAPRAAFKAGFQSGIRVYGETSRNQDRAAVLTRATGGEGRVAFGPDHYELYENGARVVTAGGGTGGSGSAGAGRQYVELTIDGTTYKVLHDGTA